MTSASTTPDATSTDRVVLRGATLFDGTGAAPGRADVVLSAGRIAEVGVDLDGDRAVDLGGRWLLPGLIDCHVHALMSSINLLTNIQRPFSLQFFQAIGNLAATLRAGVTTVRDAGGADEGVRRAVEDGLVPGPRMRLSIQILSPTGGHADGWFPSGFCAAAFIAHPGRPEATCDGPEEALRRVREVIRAGADVVKICTTGGVLSERDDPMASQFLPSEIAVIVAEARANRMEVMAHAQGVDGIRNAVEAGVSSIEHGIYLDDATIELMIERGTFLVPTLLAPRGVLDSPEGVPAASLRKAAEVVDIHRDAIGRAARAGVRIAMGTDSGVVPHGRNGEELAEMVAIGMSPTAALEAATRVAAENVGLADEIGTVEPGKVADLIAVDGDPLADITVLSDPARVTDIWQAGARVGGRGVLDA